MAGTTGRARSGAKRSDHGFWPYWLPYFGFLALAQFWPADAATTGLPFRVAVPGLLLALFASRGAYAELRGFAWADGRVALDALVGIAGAALWMAPYLLIDAARPEDAGGFDPALYGESAVWLALLLRAVGYGLVTPFMEELFVRSWLLRYVQVLERGDRRVGFRDLPIARYTPVSFVAVLAWFTVSHVPWEWPVAVAWFAGTQLYFYWRRELMAMVVVHAFSNLSILVFVVLASGKIADGQGHPIDLWFFV